MSSAALFRSDAADAGQCASTARSNSAMMLVILIIGLTAGPARVLVRIAHRVAGDGCLVGIRSLLVAHPVLVDEAVLDELLWRLSQAPPAARRHGNGDGTGR